MTTKIAPRRARSKVSPQVARSRRGHRMLAQDEVHLTETAFLEGGLEESAEDADNAGEFAEEQQHQGESSNFLMVYFREMSALAVLKPDQERAIARRIGTLELGLWEQLLSFAPLSHRILCVVEQVLDNSLPEFRAVRGAAGLVLDGDGEAHQALEQAAGAAAVKLRKLDLDRVFVSAALEEVKRIATAAPGEIGERLPQALLDLLQGPRWRRYLRDLSRTWRRIQRAKHDFVKANLRLVVSIARHFNHGRLPLPDLIQEGNLGLIKAVERFDYQRGYRFSTYASWWIRHAIARGMADRGRTVRLPVHMLDVHHRMARVKRELAGRLGRQPTLAELGEAMNMTVAKLEKMRGYLLDQPLSLNRAISPQDGRKFADFIRDESAAGDPVEALTSATLSHQVRRMLHVLKPMEADILRQRFGLDSDRELTLKEIGERYNLSRERIRQLQQQALLKMRRALAQREVRG